MLSALLGAAAQVGSAAVAKAPEGPAMSGNARGPVLGNYSKGFDAMQIAIIAGAVVLVVAILNRR